MISVFPMCTICTGLKQGAGESLNALTSCFIGRANLAALALDTLHTRMGVSTIQLSKRLIMFASDGAAVLQGRLNGVIQQVRQQVAPFAQQVAPFAQPMHCTAHRVDLSSGSLDKHPIMENTKAPLDGMFRFYSHSTRLVKRL